MPQATIAAHNGARIFGGGEKWTVLLLAGLARRGHRVRLFCNDPLVAERAGELGVPAERVRLGGDVMLPDAWRFARVLRRHAPDALLLATFKKIWLGGIAARWARVPRVVARVGLSTDLPRNVKYRLALTRWVHVAALNAQDIRSSFLAGAPSLDAGRVVTIYDGVEAPRATRDRDAARAALGLPPETFAVGATARLASQKRFDRLLLALAELPAGVHCVLAGEDEGGERGRLEELAASLGLRDRLHLPGFRCDVGNVLAALDLFVVSSDREGMSNAMLEALAAGIPVVSTPVSGAAEALEPLPDGSVPGIVVRGFEPAELTAAIRRVMNDPGLRAGMAEAARRRHAERFTFERMVDQWERLLVGTPPASYCGNLAGRHLP